MLYVGPAEILLMSRFRPLRVALPKSLRKFLVALPLIKESRHRMPPMRVVGGRYFRADRSGNTQWQESS